MDSKDREEFCSSGPDEATMAREKKRSRRVSFAAEITSVHVFDRDEDCDTSSDAKPSSENQETENSNEGLGFFRNFVDSDDSKELNQNDEDVDDDDYDDDDDDDGRPRGLFVQNMDSPGSTLGSATSNDEDNFFGPVSASFIRSGRLSDAASDDNHDITLDSTAFSLHFRSLMQSDSEGNLKTPTRTHLTFDAKTTPTEISHTNSGDSMVLTGVVKPIPLCSTSGGNSSAGSGSDDMSLIEDNPHRYDYGRISPTLDALLAGGVSKLATSAGFHTEAVKDLRDNELENAITQVTKEKFENIVHDDGMKLLEGNGVFSVTDQHSYPSPPSAKGALLVDASNIHLNKSTGDTPSGVEKEPANDIPKGHESQNDINGGTDRTFTPVNENIQMNVTTENDCGYPRHVDDRLKEETMKGGRSTPDIGRKANQGYESPEEGSVSSLRAKRQRLLLDATAISGSELITTPFSGKPPFSSLNNESIIRNGSASSIYKSHLKHKVDGTSHLGSMQELSDDDSKPDYFCKSPILAAILDKYSEYPNMKQISDAVVGSEENGLNVSREENTEHRATIEMNAPCFETPKTIGAFGQKEESVDTLYVGDCRNHIYAGNNQHGGLSAAAKLTLSQMSNLRREVQAQPLVSHNLTGGVVVNPKSDSSPKVIYEVNRMDRVRGTPADFIASPLRLLHGKLSASPREKCISGLQKVQEQYENIANPASREDSEDLQASNVLLPSPMADRPTIPASVSEGKIADEASLKDNKVQLPSSIVINANNTKSTGNSNDASSSEVLCHDLQVESGNIGPYETPLGYKTTLNPQSGVLRTFGTRTDPTGFKERLLGKNSSFDSASPYLRKRTDTATRLQKRLSTQFAQVPSTEEPCSLSEDGSTFVGNHQSLSTSIQCSIGHVNATQLQDFHISQNSLPVEDVLHSGQKRKIDEAILMDKDITHEKSKLSSPKVGFQTENRVSSDNGIGGNIKAAGNGGYANTFSSFSEAMKRKLMPSADKLNLKEISVLEDFLGRLQKANMYAAFCTELKSQKVHDHLVNLQQKRVAEARAVQQRLVYERAKLQLSRLKHERLLENIRLLHSRIQESEVLKSNYLPYLNKPGSKYAQHHPSRLQPNMVDHNNEAEEALTKVAARRQELGALDQKVKQLLKSVIISCKIRGDPSCADTIVLVNEYLKKKTDSRNIRQELQIWKVDTLESKNGHHDLVLNYCDILFQRFIVNVRPAPSIVTISKLNETKIKKSLPNLNACTAFAFVFDAEITRNLLSPKNFALETQLTSSLLGNLLDVVEEVQMANIELRNLIKTSFHSPSVEQLDLQLHFIDYKTGSKLTLTLDLTSLNRGVYPAEILPSQLHTQTYGIETSQPLSAQISAAIGSLKAGHSRIRRLCKCVVQVLTSPSR